MKVAVLGVGLMGSAAVERLSNAGFDVVVWNRTREKAEAVAGRFNVRVARDPMDAVSDRDAALAFLAADDALMSVVGSIGRVDGLIFVNSSTVTPRASRLAASYLESRGACYVDAPVIGGPGSVREGKLIVVASGRRSCINRVYELFNALSEKLVVVGEEPGQASAVKLAYNALLISSIGVLGEALLLVESHGVDKGVFKDILLSSVFEGLASRYFDRVSSGGKLSFRMALAAKDLEYAGRAAYDVGAPTPIIESASGIFRLASVKCGDSDYTGIYRFIKEASCMD